MASVPFVKPSNQVSSSTSGKIPGFSKAQMCLKKIIDIISSRGISRGSSLNPKFDGVRPDETASGEEAVTLFPCQRGFHINLNLRLGSLLETVGSENPTDNEDFSACSAVGGLDSKVCRINIDCNSSPVSVHVSTIEKSSEGECDPKDVGNSSGDFEASMVKEELEAVEEEMKEFSEITNLRGCEETEDVEKSETRALENQEEEEQRGRDKPEEEEPKAEEKRRFWNRENENDGYLGLLVEAARLISGNLEDEESEPASGESLRRAEAETETKEPVGCSSKRNQCWMFDIDEGFEDISPVVRSKRGRNQVLPCRYRDSVLEPWKRLPRQRSTRVSTKRKPR